MTADSKTETSEELKEAVTPVPEGPKEGPLAAYKGERPSAPEWFTRALSQEPSHGAVEVDGATIRYLQWGERSKPGLLLTHGNGAHAHWWSFIAPYLAGEYNVAALSLGGMGDSDRRTDYSMETFAKEQLAVAEDAGMFAVEEPPIIVGHSFGGFVTILTGALYGERLAGTILLDSPVTPPDRDRGGPPRDTRPARIYPNLALALSRFRLAPPQECENHYILDYIARHSLTEVAGEDGKPGWTWKFDPAIWQRFSIGEMSERLKQTKCRIGILYGAESAIFPRKVGRYMYGLLGKAVPVVEIPEARHHVFLDQPLATVAALRTLLQDWDHSTPARTPSL